MLDPLHHLLPRDDHPVPFPKLLLQPVERKMIVVTGQQNVHCQPGPHPALGNQPRQKRGNSHTSLPARAGILRPHGPSAYQPRRDQIDLFADLFSDPHRHPAAARTGFQLRLENVGLRFQVCRQGMPGTPSFAAVLLSVTFPVRMIPSLFQHAIAGRFRLAGLGFRVFEQAFQLLFLLPGQPIGLRAKHLALQLGNPGPCLGQPLFVILLLGLQLPTQIGILGLELRCLGLQLGLFGLQALVFGQQIVVAHGRTGRGNRAARGRGKHL